MRVPSALLGVFRELKPTARGIATRRITRARPLVKPTSTTYFDDLRDGRSTTIRVPPVACRDARHHEECDDHSRHAGPPAAGRRQVRGAMRPGRCVSSKNGPQASPSAEAPFRQWRTDHPDPHMMPVRPSENLSRSRHHQARAGGPFFRPSGRGAAELMPTRRPPAQRSDGPLAGTSAAATGRGRCNWLRWGRPNERGDIDGG
jgi:hypothetical protein